MVGRLAPFGREREIDELKDFVAAAMSGPVALLLEGDAGIGKTTLWRAAVAYAEASGYRVLACRPAEAEAQLAFAALGDLLGDVFDEAASKLPSPQARALEVALLRSEPDAPLLPQAVSLGALGALRSLARSSPVLLAIDDAQWLDEPTATVLEFVARRLRKEPVGVLVALRGGGDAVPLALDRALADPVRRLRVGPLAGESLALIVRGRVGAEFSAEAIGEIETASGGNPYFALELASARSRAVGGEEHAVPASVQALIADRLFSVSSAAQEVALVVAALARPSVALIEACAPAAVASGALAEAIRVGLIEVERDQIEFSHPLVASVVYATATEAHRRDIHRRIAACVDDDEERARHLALASDGPDPVVAEALDTAARSVRARGAPGEAAQLYEQAQRFTPPTDADAAARRAIEAAECHFEGGDVARVRPLLEAVVDTTTAERARALAFLGWVRAYQEGYVVGVELFRAALAALGDDTRQRIEIERGLAWSLHELGHLDEADGHVRAALSMAERLGDPRLLARAMADLAFHEFVTMIGDPMARIEHALAIDPDDAWQPIIGRPRWIHVMLLEWRGELVEAHAAGHAMLRAAEDRGDEHAFPYFLFHLARTALLAGEVEEAQVRADAAYRAAAESGQESELPFGLVVKALVAAQLGDVETTRGITDEGMDRARRLGAMPAFFELRATRAFLELSLGDHEAALRLLAPLHEEVTASGFAEPALFRYHGDLIEALLGVERLDEAAVHLAALRERTAGREHHWADAVAARGEALLLAAQGDSVAALAALDRAYEAHDRLRHPLELARMHLAAGTVRRRARQKRPARGAFEAAIEIFDQLGAAAWSARTRAELARVSGRPSTTQALTPTERRVAELIAGGNTYREAANVLFISPKTVQWNLSKIYRKLGIRSRAQLAAALAATAPDASNPADRPVRS